MTAAVTKRKNGQMEFARREADAPAWWEGMHDMGAAGKLPEGATIEQWIKAAGLDWIAQRSFVRYYVDKAMKDLRADEDTHVLVRSDTKDKLGIVSSGYEIVQPRECLEFFRDLTDALGFKLITAGSLHGGRKVWAQADIGSELQVVKGDTIKGRLLFATSLDGSMHTIAKDCAERVVCANTFAVAMGQKGVREVRVSHRSKFDEAKVKRELGLVVESFAKFIKQAKEMAKHHLNTEQAERLTFATLARDASVLSGRDVSRAEGSPDLRILDSRGYRMVMDLFGGKAQGYQMLADQRAADTTWGWFNSITEYTDHHVKARSEANRIDSAMFGYADDTKALAFEYATAAGGK